MWNSCAMEFVNNLLKINSNGKLRTEISSAALCSQCVTWLHISAGSSSSGAGSDMGAAFPQSAQLQAGFCFQKPQLHELVQEAERRQQPSLPFPSTLLPRGNVIFGQLSDAITHVRKAVWLPSLTVALQDGFVFPCCSQDGITPVRPTLDLQWFQLLSQVLQGADN